MSRGFLTFLTFPGFFLIKSQSYLEQVYCALFLAAIYSTKNQSVSLSVLYIYILYTSQKSCNLQLMDSLSLFSLPSLQCLCAWIRPCIGYSWIENNNGKIYGIRIRSTIRIGATNFRSHIIWDPLWKTVNRPCSNLKF